MINLTQFINILTLLSLVNSSVRAATAVPRGDDELFPDVLYHSSNVVVEGGFVKIMSNISFTCAIKFDCAIPQPNGCTQGQDIKWLIPRELVEHQIIFGINSSRIRFTPQKYYVKSRYFVVRSQMNISDVGTIHNGMYYCNHDYSRNSINFLVPVRGRDMRGECDFGDQCLSGNCYQNQCKCDVNEVYDSSNNLCYKVADYDGACTNDLQCTFKLGKGAAKCSNGRCACNTGFTAITRALFGRMCYKIVPLNHECEERDQCLKSDNYSYCSFKKRCECNTGYHNIGDKCKPYKKCDSSHLGDNTNYTRGTCDQNEWCTQSVCLCRPNYGFDQNGYCISLRAGSDDDNLAWYERYGYYIIGVLGAFLLVALFMIAFQVHRYKQQTRVLVSQSSSRDPLDRS